MIEVVIPPTDWADDLALLGEQTEILQRALASVDDEMVGQPSALPGWSRGHVLAHLDGNAQGIARLARWAADEVERPMYISREVRDADVELHATRDARAHEAAVGQSARALREDFDRLSDQQRAMEVMLGNGLRIRASSLARHRLQEVCVHHADLGLASYSWRDWPESMAAHMIRLVARDFAERGDFPVSDIIWTGVAGDERVTIVPGDVTLRGEAPAILAWLLGRSSGEDVTITGMSDIPPAPTWR